MTLEPGKTLGKWTLLERCQTSSGRSSWLCRCECGKIKNVVEYHLKGGTSRSCGCGRVAQHSKAVAWALQTSKGCLK